MPDRAAQPEAPANELEVSPEMIEAGAQAILECVGGSDLSPYFSAQQLAGEVYRAMNSCR